MTESNRTYSSPIAEVIVHLYKQGYGDEGMPPVVLYSKENNKAIGRFQDGDYIIFYNIRGEREVELSQSLTDPDFEKFPVKKIKLNMATMIEYDPNLNVKVAFPRSGRIKNTLSEVVSKAGYSQLKIAESEKKIHLNYFLNGKREDAFLGEERVVIESPRVDRYDAVPRMAAAKVSRKIIAAINMQKYDLIIANLCNIDVIGHSENIQAIREAVQTVDCYLGEIVAAGRRNNFSIIITADHGTVEDYYYSDGTINTGHTKSQVPFIFIDHDHKDKVDLAKNGSLIDIAPTVLSLLNIEKPSEMSGNSLLGDLKAGDKKPVLLLILDGWGYRAQEKGNLIAQSETPNMDTLMDEYPFVTVEAAGAAVGMPKGTVGNSEAGHLHIGAGRIVLSDRKRIDNSIEDKSFFENETFKWAMQGAKRDKKNLHLLGIVSFYSSHGTLKHLFPLMEMAKKEGMEKGKLFIHAMLGRRGEKPESGAIYVNKVDKKAKEIDLGRVVSVIGRKWAMDREENWDRVAKAYRLFVYGEGERILV